MKKSIMWLLVIGLVASLLVAGCARPAPPKTIVFGANPAGSLFHAMGVGLAKVVGDHTPMEVELLPQGGTIWYPMLETKEVDFGIVSPVEALAAYQGEEVFREPTKGKGHRLIRTLMLGSPIDLAFIVPGDSDIKSAKELKGKRVPTDYGAFFATTISAKALLANVGLTFDDVKGIPVTTYVEGIRAVIEGKADAAVASIGSAVTKELKAAKGARILPLDPSPEAMARTQKIFAGYFPTTVKPGPPGVDKELKALGYDITLVVRDDLGENVVYEIVKALWENYKELGAIHGKLKKWTPDRFASTHAVIPYHTGAIKWYKEKGVWTKELEDHQKKLLAK